MGRRWIDGFEWYVRGTDFSPNHEDWLRSMVTKFEGELFVDVGAHIGTWAIRATKSFSRVVAFEPNIRSSRIFRTTIRMNGLTNISVFAALLSNENSGGTASTAGKISTGANQETIPIRTLDSFRLKPSLIKIDTEGYEYPVLQGASETLDCRPRIIVETHSPESLGKVRDYLESREYSIKEARRRNRFGQIQSWLLCI